MKKYWIFFKGEWQKLFEYRIDLLVYCVMSVITPLVGLATWLSLDSSVTYLVYQRNELIIYFLLVTILSLVTFSWKGWYIAEDINRGDINKFLLKPFPFLAEYLIGTLAQKTIQINFIILLVIFVGYLLSVDISQLRLSVLQIFLFLLSMFFAMFISVILDIAIGVTTFWFHDVSFLEGVSALIISLLSGKLIPLAFLPLYITEIGVYLPFRYMISFPIEIILGRLSLSEIILGFFIQLTWLGLSYLLYRFLLNKGLEIYTSYSS